MKKVAYQGEPGAYSDEAVSAVFPDAQAVGFATFRMTFEALAMGAADAAVLPVENSSAGVVQEVSDLLWETPGLRVVPGTRGQVDRAEPRLVTFTQFTATQGRSILDDVYRCAWNSCFSR